MTKPETEKHLESLQNRFAQCTAENEQLWSLLGACEDKCDEALHGPTRYQEHYTGILREIRDMVREARK